MLGGRIRYLGDYELIEEIARGGMGIVYHARQVSLNRAVAVKLILTSGIASENFVQRFQTEAEASATLDHPNIVPIHEIGSDRGRHYFSMKLIEGPSLARHLKETRMSAREAARMMAAVAHAIHYAHQRGVLHRDVKPGNILLDPTGKPWLTDFGLAKLAHRDSGITRTHALVGTPAYMAPEQARGRARVLTTAADVYSLGAVLYECLTGRPPFVGETPLETLRMVLEQEPDSPRSLDAGIDRDLETICLRCLEKDPESRYASAKVVAEELERWLRGRHIPGGSLALTSFPELDPTRWYRAVFRASSSTNTVLLRLSAELCEVGKPERIGHLEARVPVAFFAGSVTVAAIDRAALAGVANNGVTVKFDNLRVTGIAITPTTEPAVTVKPALILSWPARALGSVLESAMKADGPWNSSAVSPVVIGDDNTVTLENSADAQFFRLRKP